MLRRAAGMSAADDEADTSCYRWSRDFVVAHAIFAGGLVTFPAAVFLLIDGSRSGRAIFFAAFAAICTITTLILCCRFYAELRRPPWPRWLSGGLHQQQGDDAEAAASASAAVAGEETTMRAMSQAALAAGRVPSYSYAVGDGGAAEDCAVCLGELEKGETVRQLPACQHVFHRECIDPWLRAHGTCPICRSIVLPAPERPVEVIWWTSEQFMGRPG